MATSRAIVFIAYGKQYIKEVERAIASVNNQFPCVVCTLNGREFDSAASFKIPKRQSKYHWFLDRCRYFNYIFTRLTDYDQLLFLDSDVFVCGDLSGYFKALRRFDIVGTYAISQETYQRDDIPASFPELHGGAFAVNQNYIVKRLLERWLEIYEKKPAEWGNDQPPLRQALWEMRHIQIGILPIEYCFRYRWGGLLSRKVVLLHGKEHKTPYEQVAHKVNAQAGEIRIFHRRELA